LTLTPTDSWVMSGSQSVSRAGSPTHSENSFSSITTKPHPLLQPRRSSTSSTSSTSTPPPFINFAQQGNPTIQVNLTRRSSFQFTYAEVLQYACILLTTRELSLFLFFSSSSSFTSRSSPRLARSSLNVFFYLDVLLLIICLSSLEFRKRAEGFGLRRISLMIYIVLFLFTCMLVFLGATKAGGLNKSSHMDSRFWGEQASTTLCSNQNVGNMALRVLASSTDSCQEESITAINKEEVVTRASQALYEPPLDQKDEPSLLDALCYTYKRDREGERRQIRLAKQGSRHSIIIECNIADTNDT
jgi:hypothetical protein